MMVIKILKPMIRTLKEFEDFSCLETSNLIIFYSNFNCRLSCTGEVNRIIFKDVYILYSHLEDLKMF